MMDSCTKCYNLATKITLIYDFPEKKVLAALSFCEISVPLQPKRTKRCRVITILYKRVGKGSCHLPPTFALLQ